MPRCPARVALLTLLRVLEAEHVHVHMHVHTCAHGRSIATRPSGPQVAVPAFASPEHLWVPVYLHVLCARQPVSECQGVRPAAMCACVCHRVRPAVSPYLLVACPPPARLLAARQWVQTL